jgi:hypothetical protein
MATESLISWNTPEHLYFEKKADWYWAVGIITLAAVAVSFIFGQILLGIFIIVAMCALVIHASKRPRIIYCEINDRGVVVDKTLYPFLSLESFCVPHDEFPPKLLMKSRRMMMPFIVVFINEVDPEEVRGVMLRYIAEKEHREPILKYAMEYLGF